VKTDFEKCKDVEFARNLIKQMDKGYGRHNSNRSFRGVHCEGPMVLLPLRTGSNQHLPIFHLWPIDESRVVGRLGGKSIREKWEDCEIGDGVKDKNMDDLFSLTSCQFVNKVSPGHPDGCLFERVRFSATSLDLSMLFHEEVIWKRIS